MSRAGKHPTNWVEGGDFRWAANEKAIGLMNDSGLDDQRFEAEYKERRKRRIYIAIITISGFFCLVGWVSF